MDKASQDGREHGQDEKAEWPSENVEDESVLRALTALLKTPWWMFETLMWRKGANFPGTLLDYTNLDEGFDCFNIILPHPPHHHLIQLQSHHF